MTANTRVNLARRSFLKAGVGAGAGLTLGVILPPLAARCGRHSFMRRKVASGPDSQPAVKLSSVT